MPSGTLQGQNQTTKRPCTQPVCPPPATCCARGTPGSGPGPQGAHRYTVPIGELWCVADTLGTVGEAQSVQVDTRLAGCVWMCVHTGVTGTPGLPCAGTAWTPQVSQPLALSTRPVALRRARCACGPGSCWLVCAQAACEWAEHTPLHTHVHTGTHSQAVPQLLRVTRRPQGPQALLQGGHCQDKRDRYKEQRSSARRCPDARVRALLLGAQRRGGQDLGDHRSDRVPARPRHQGCAVPGAPHGPSMAHTHHSYPQQSPQGTPPPAVLGLAPGPPVGQGRLSSPGQRFY